MGTSLGAIALLVHDYDEAIAWYTSALGFVLLEDSPRNEDYGSVAVFEDLYGNRWDLLQLRP